MFDFRYLLIIILVGISLYLIYNLYSFHSAKVDKLKENILESFEIECEEINEKLENLEDLVKNSLGEYNKKISDLLSLQYKMNDVNKMNNQSIINQINQYDEGIEELDELKNQVFNSVENDINENSDVNLKNNKDNCFVKLNNSNKIDKEQFYMSPENKSEDNSIIYNNNNIDIKNKDNTENSTVLELSSDFIKMAIPNKDNKSNNIFKILNESTNLMKDNLYYKLNKQEINDSSDVSEINADNIESSPYVINKNNNLDKESEIESNNTNSNESTIPIEFINNLKKNNNKIIEIN